MVQKIFYLNIKSNSLIVKSELKGKPFIMKGIFKSVFSDSRDFFFSLKNSYAFQKRSKLLVLSNSVLFFVIKFLFNINKIIIESIKLKDIKLYLDST